MREIKDEVIGRWTSIFEHFGINVGDGRHCECPLCGTPGHKKPFRYDNIDGTGSWICNYCGAGDGWRLYMRKMEVDFPTAIKEITPILGSCAVRDGGMESKVSPEALRKLFQNSTSMKNGDIAAWYLQNRGLSIFPPTLRTTKRCWEKDTKKFYSAMLAVFHSHRGEALTMHRTYLNEHGEKLGVIEDPKRIMPALGKLSGGAVRLFAHDGVLGIAEGIETAIAAHELFNVSVWSSLTAQLMESFEPSEDLKTLFIFGDNDKNCRGQKAAYTLASRLLSDINRIKSGLEVYVKIPEAVGTDWLDVLNKKNSQ